MKEGQGGLKVNICLCSFFFDLISLCGTSDGNSINFSCLLVSFLVLDIKHLQQLVGVFGGCFQLDSLRSEIDL